MANGIGKPEEDIKKYDFSFLDTPLTPQVEASTEEPTEEPKSTAQDLYGFGFDTETQKKIDEHYKRLDNAPATEPIDHSMGGGEMVGRSLLAGFGDVFEGFGDAVDWVNGSPDSRLLTEKQISKEIYGLDIHTPIADKLHEIGAELQKYGESVPGLKDVQDVTWADMFDDDFWLTHWARALPFSLTFLIPGTQGAKLAGMGYKGLRAAQSLKGLSVGSALARTGLVTATKGSQVGLRMAQFWGGAMAGNFSEGAIIAGQTMNDAVEQGVPHDLAAVAAADTFKDNAWWMAIDGLQLALFTGTARAINPFAKTIKTMRAPGIKRLMQNTAKVAGYALTDGTFEQFQEVYQDWSMKKNIAEQKGEDFASYLDYFNSQEALPTRVIAFTSSLAVTGAKTAIDVSAERKRLFARQLAEDGLVQENLEILNMQVEDYNMEDAPGTPIDRTVSASASDELAALKRDQLTAYMMRSVNKGRTERFLEYLETMTEEGNGITNAQKEAYKETVKQLEEVKKLAPDALMNDAEQNYLMSALFQKETNKQTYEQKKEYWETEKQKLEDSDVSKAQKKAALEGINNELSNLERAFQKADSSINTTVDNIFADNAARLQEERLQKEIDPQLRSAAKKNLSGGVMPGALSKQEVSAMEDNKSRYDKIYEEERTKQAQAKLGNKYKPVANNEKGNTDLIFQRKLKKVDGFQVIEEKRVDENGNITTEVIKPDAIIKNAIKNTKLKAEENQQKLDEEARIKEVQDEEVAKQEKEQTDFEWDSKDNFVADKVTADQRVNDSKAKKFFGRRLIGKDSKGNLVYETVLTESQRYVWAQNFMESNPDIGIYFDENLTDPYGRGAQGAAIGLSVFINPDEATQEVFLHESWHAYQEVFKNSPEIKALLKEIIKQPIFKKVKNKNHLKIKYNKDGMTMTLSKVIHNERDVLKYMEWAKKNGVTNTYSDTSYASYMDYISSVLGNRGYSMLPNSKQDLIANEALATAGGFQNANNIDYFVEGAGKSRYLKKLKNAWGMIREKINPKAAKEHLKNNFPTLYDEDFGVMLEKAQQEFQNPNKERTYAALRKQQDIFYLTNYENKLARNTIEQSIIASDNLALIKRDARTALDKMIADKSLVPDEFQQAEMLDDVMSLNKGRILTKVLENATYGQNEDVVGYVNEYYNKNASQIDDMLQGYYLDAIKEEVAKRFSEDAISEEMYAELEEATEKAFGDIISENFSRKMNTTVSRKVNEFLELYNENKEGDNIMSKYSLYEALSAALDGTKHDFSLFEDRIVDLVRFHNETKINELNTIVSNKEGLLAEFVMYTQASMSHGNDALHSMWHYFRSFKLEKATSWRIGSDNTVILEHALPIADRGKVRDFKEKAMEALRNDKESGAMITALVNLQLMKDENSKEQAILNFVEPFYSAFENNKKTLAWNDLANIYVDGANLQNYFTEERINELQDAIANIDYTFFFKEGGKYKSRLRPSLNRLLSNVENINEIQKKELITFFERKVVEWGNLTPDQRDAQHNAKLWTEAFKNKISKAWLKPTKQGDTWTINKFDSLYNKLYVAMYQVQGKAGMTGMVLNPAGDSVDLFSKSSYIHNSLEHLERVLPEMTTAEVRQLFRGNIIAQQIAKRNYMPQVVLNLGVYDARIAKGKKNSQVKPSVFTTARVTHLLERILQGAQYYNHFVGQLGDSSRQYYINNGIVWDNAQTKTQLEWVNRRVGSGQQLTDQRVAEEVAKLVERLEESPLVDKYSSDKLIKGLEKVVKINFINKFLYSDLYYNREYAQTYQEEGKNLLADLSKRTKGMASPVITAHGKRIEPIFIQDPTPGGIQLADSASYMLPEHAKMLRVQYGEFEGIGKNLKTLYYGQNLDNSSFAREMGGHSRIPMYLKTHTHVITDSFIKDMPKESRENIQMLKALIDKRAQDLKGTNTIPVIYFTSSIKGGLLSEQMNKASYTMQQVKEVVNDINNPTAYDPSGLTRPTLSQSLEFRMKQNRLYQFEKEGEIMYGFDGNFFGIQNTLDNYNRTSGLAKQWIANVGVINTVPRFEALGKTGDTVTKELNDKFGDILMALYRENFEGKNLQEMYDEKSKEHYSFLDNESVEQYGPNFIANRQLYSNAIAATFKRKVMSIRMSGTLSTEMTDIAFNFSIDKENVAENEQLKSYRIENDKVEVAEIVIPRLLADNHKVKEGDLIFAARIPNSKIGDGLVFKVKHIMGAQEGNAVIIPSKHAALIGSDKDGDQLHIAVVNKGKTLKESDTLKNELLEMMFELYQQNEMMDLILKEIEFGTNITEKGLNHVRTLLSQEELQDFDKVKSDLSFIEEESLQERFIGNSVMLGIVASLNRAFNYFASGISNVKVDGLKTKAYYRDGQTINMTFINSVKDSNGKRVGKSERLGFIENITKDGNEVWATYAQFLNFIIDDGKFGNRAKFRMQEESANHFAFMMRMGLSLETVLDVMFDPVYGNYIKALGSGLSKTEALKKATGLTDIDRSVDTVTSPFLVDMKDGFITNPEAFTSLVVSLDSFGRDMRIFQRVASFDANVPTNYLDAYILDKQFQDVKSRQRDMGAMFNRNKYLSSQYEIFQQYMEQLKEEDIFGQEEADLIYSRLDNTLDLSRPETTKLLYNTFHFNKMAVYLKPDALVTNDHKGGLNFLDLLYQYGPANQVKIKNLEGKYKNNPARLEEERLRLINREAFKLIKQNRNNGFIKMLDYKQDRKVMRNYGTKADEVFFLNNININNSYYNSINSKKVLNGVRNEFLKLPSSLQNYFIAYEFFNNKLGTTGNKTLIHFLPSNVRSEVKRASNHIYKNRDKNTISNELKHANALLEDVLKIDKNIEQLTKQQLSESSVATYRMIELLNAYDTVGLKNSLHAFNQTKVDSKGRMVSPRLKLVHNEAYERIEGDVEVNNQLVDPAVRMATDSEIESLGAKAKGKRVYVVETAEYKDGKFSTYNKNYIYGDFYFSELNIVNTYANSIQKNYQDLVEDDVFYLYSDKAGSFMFGQDTDYNLEEFGKAKGVVKWNVSIDDLIENDRPAYNRLNTEFAEYKRDLKFVQDLRADIDNDTRIQRDTEGLAKLDAKQRKKIDSEYIKELPNVISEYYTMVMDKNPMAIENISKELQFMYGEALTHEQQMYWGKTKEGQTLLDKVSKADASSDISMGQMLFSPGDFGQKHPTLAATRRQMERGNQLMHHDLKRVTDELNEVYNALYKDKFMFASATKLATRIPILNMFKSQESVNDVLFENLLVRKSFIHKKTHGGKTTIDHKTIHKLNKEIFSYSKDRGTTLKKPKDMKIKLSKAEMDYAKVVARYLNFYDKLSIAKNLYSNEAKRGRALYAPVADASRFEVLRRRGLYGVYYQAMARDGELNSIVVKGLNILNGKIERKTLGDFKSIYSTSKQEAKEFLAKNPAYASGMNLSNFSNLSRISGLRKLQSQASSYFNNGIDIDGKVIKTEDGVNAVLTTEGKTFNRYISERSHRAAYLSSGNLQYAMYNYLKTMVFQHGTEFRSSGGWNRIEFKMPESETRKKRESIVLSNQTLSSNDMTREAKEGRLSDSMKQRHMVPNFRGFESYKFLISSAQQYLGMQGGTKENSIKYLQEVMMENFIEGKPKKTLTGTQTEKAVLGFLTNMTMFVGLGLNVKAAIFNVVIGKYNAWKTQSTANFLKAHARSFGLSRDKGYSRKDSRKTKLLLEEFGILTYRPEEQLEGQKMDTYLSRIFFYPMVRAERFIQEVQFIGELTDEQWKAYSLDENDNLVVVDNKNILSIDDIAKIQRKVQNMQGRGYSALDARLIQTFMLGSSLLQFKRWFPTFITEKVGKTGYTEWMDDYGQIYAGSLNAFATKDGKAKLSRFVNPLHYMKFLLNPKNISSAKMVEKYMKEGLSRAQGEAMQRLQKANVGIIMLATFLLSQTAAAQTPEEKEITKQIEKLLGDILLGVNMDKLAQMMVMPAFTMFYNLWNLNMQLILYYGSGKTKGVYKKDSKYGAEGDPKFRRFAAAMTPNLSIPGTEFSLKTSLWGAPAKPGEKLRAAKRLLQSRKQG